MKLLFLVLVALVTGSMGADVLAEGQKIIFPCAQGNPCDAAYCARFPNVECRPELNDPCKPEFFYEFKGKFVLLKNCMNDKPCSEACPRIYMPMCGSDGKTYGNECELSVAKCKSKGKIRFMQPGECDE